MWVHIGQMMTVRPRHGDVDGQGLQLRPRAHAGHVHVSMRLESDNQHICREAGWSGCRDVVAGENFRTGVLAGATSE